jgi:hypothetical protein
MYSQSGEYGSQWIKQEVSYKNHPSNFSKPYANTSISTGILIIDSK